MAASFGFSGQKCSACSRAIIVEDVYDQVLNRVVELTNQLTVGDPADQNTFMGPVNDKMLLIKLSIILKSASRKEVSSWWNRRQFEGILH